MKIKLYTDGAARGNPGPAGAGAFLSDENGNSLKESFKYLGETTNNQAEYRALKLGLEESVKLAPEEINIFADSELMVKQLNGEYKVKNKAIKVVYLEIVKLLQNFPKYTISHIRREYNKVADALANRAIDEHEI